ncbi:SIS domain-containing protein [Shewanella avicenniae]|uniref:SIS domain-containing protein n=2 Tax=Shewanella avicenniae TaxID=2814294 RepID=A0ABX7QXX9_9GAMM|nr:SIS domain-containing protein [Shewanella avicenniae]
MAVEASETPNVVRLQQTKNNDQYQVIAEHISRWQPEFVYMIGRGTSDHAGVFAKYLIETELGLPVCHAAPSVNSVFGKQLNLRKALVIVISQSGKSPDIIAQTQMAKAAGALCIALVNDVSPKLMELVDYFVPLHAGPELAVAATKSYLATLSALLSIVAYTKKDNELKNALTDLPQLLTETIARAPQLSADEIAKLERCVVLGRGFGYAIAREVALKMKEVCRVQAEAFSSAEFLHGPISLLNRGLTLLDISIPDATTPYHVAQIEEVKQRGGHVMPMSWSFDRIPPLLVPLLIMQRFYLDIELAAAAMGLDPDKPQGLKKVTETV